MSISRAFSSEFYADVKGRMRNHGREPDQCAILPAISVVLGETEAIARERVEYLDSLENPDLSRAYGSAMLGADLARVKTVEELAAKKGSQGHGGLEDNMKRIMKDDGVSLEEANRRSHRLVVGTPSMVADYMPETQIDRFNPGAASVAPAGMIARRPKGAAVYGGLVIESKSAG